MMKKNLIPVLVVVFTSIQPIYSQTTTLQGKPIAEIFTDFHYSINDTSQTTGFGINRACLGYNFLPDDNLSATIVVNIGNPDELGTGTTHRRYAHFREVCINWEKERVRMSFGITGTRIFRYQQQFWGKRYVANNVGAANGYGFVSDLGVSVDYQINDHFKADFTLMNGEGYSELQMDNSLKSSFGLSITPVNEILIRIYGDVSKPDGKWHNTTVFFAGYKNAIITIGGEIVQKSNLDLIEGHNAWGVSGTGSIKLYKNIEYFMRYDYSASSIPQGEILQWHYEMDGNFMIAGFQYTFTNNFKIALNYQGTDPYFEGRQRSDMIFLNTHFNF